MVRIIQAGAALTVSDRANTGPGPIRVPLSQLRANPGGWLESARQRRVLLTRRGKVVGELIPLDEPGAATVRPLLGIGRDLLRLDTALDLTEADWDAEA